ncbi:heavy-metal-associated domain-containing protein [Paeniglutamicibacter sp. MACA_103]|uniref:heavy-metal-associated domain-containing protein n=1 Tax=Paeniglutamicibacter sp. MACA_103 TaxID=3377337 RepID=UPI003894F19B
MSETSSGGCCGGSCGCNSSEGLTITTRPEDTMAQNHITLKIDGMTCGHCVASVTEELRDVEGVTDVEVILSAGGTSTANITASTQIQETLLAQAVQEAGYTLVSTDA